MKEALKLALRDLENAEIATNSTYESTMLIREALAQPAQGPMSDKELQKWIDDAPAAQPAQKRPQNCGTGFCSCIECVMGAAQEPDELTIAYMSGLYDGKKKRPWVGLTDKLIEATVKKEMVHEWATIKTFARAIEAKLKERNT